MKRAFLVLAIISIGTLLLAESEQSGRPKACGDSCLTEIRGLSSKYEVGSPVEFTIHNRSTQDVYVNVAVEALYSNFWREILLSVSDSRHPFGKALKPTLVRAGSQIALSYDAWNGPVKKVHAPNLQRLRVDEYVGPAHQTKQESWSQAFELVSQNSN